MTPFRLKVLGNVGLSSPSGDPVRFRTRKHFGLLLVLAVDQKFHRRDWLTSILWPNADTEEARHSLATGLSFIRGRLGANSIETLRDSVRLVPGLVISDIYDLESDRSATGIPTVLGPFLDDFDIDESAGFLHWKDGLRARLFPLLFGSLTQRIELARRSGDWHGMQELASQLLHIDELNEQGIRAQLEARAMAGDRIGAIRIFDRWESRLARELGASPSKPLLQVVERLRHNSCAPQSTIGGSKRAGDPESGHFLGRGFEFAKCYDSWESAKTGRPTHVLLHGDVGTGKTRVLERVIAAVALEGAVVAKVKCYELEQALPFGMIGGVVIQLLDLPGASGTPPENLVELGRVVGKVHQKYPGLPAAGPSTTETARLVFCESLIALIAAIADERPVVISVDDIHRADVTSLAILHMLLRRIENIRVMFALASTPPRHDAPIEVRKFAEHGAAIGLSVIAVHPLAPEISELLLKSILGEQDSVGLTVRRAILLGAKGNPLAIELLVEDWRRRGSDCLALSLGAMTSHSEVPPTDAFSGLAESLLSALDAECRSVAELGAILGQRLNDLTMYSLIDLPVARTMRAMTTLVSAKVLRDVGNALEFSNDFIRGQCYVQMAGTLRRVLHGSVADRLLAERTNGDPLPGLEVAWHLVRADRLPEAVPFLLDGGRDSIRKSAPHEAELALSTGLPCLNGAAKKSAVLLLAEAQQELGRWGDSLRLLDENIDGFDNSELGQRLVYQILARRWLGHLSVDAMVEATSQLFDIALSDVTVETRVKALAASVRLLALSRNQPQLDKLDAIVPVVGSCPMDRYQRLHFILSRAWVLALKQRSDAALTAVRRGVLMAEDGQIASSIVVRLLVGEGNLLSMDGCYFEALEPLRKAAAMSERIDNHSLRGECATQLAVVEGRLGRSSAQIEWAREALRTFSPTDWCAAQIGATYELGLGLVAEGRFDEAQESVRALSSRNSSEIPAWANQASLLCQADVIALSGNRKRALTLARKATTGELSSVQHIGYAGQFARWVALVAVRDGRPELGGERLREIFPDLRGLDRKDAAEVLAAQVLLEVSVGRSPVAEVREVGRRLAALPPSVSYILNELGICSFRRIGATKADG